MEIAYQLTIEKNKKLWQDYYRKTVMGRRIVNYSLWFMWWLIICLSLLISLIVRDEHGVIAAFIVFLLLNTAYLGFGRFLIARWFICADVKKIKDENNEKNVSLTESHIQIRAKRTDMRFLWEGVGRIVKADNSLWFEAAYFNFQVPACVFESEDKYSAFCELAQQYHQKSAFREEKKKKLSMFSLVVVWLLPIICGLIILSALSEAGGRHNAENTKKDETIQYSKDFLKKAFADDVYAYTDYFTPDFQNRMTKQEWQTIVSGLKGKIGEIEEVEVIAYQHWCDPNTIRGFFFTTDINTKGDTDKTILKIVGKRDSVYMSVFVKSGIGAWRLDGFDIIEVQDVKLKTTSYSTESDRRLFGNVANEPNTDSKHIIKNVETSTVIKL